MPPRIGHASHPVGPPIATDASVTGLVDRYILAQRAFSAANVLGSSTADGLTTTRWELTSQMVDGQPWHHELALLSPEGAIGPCVLWLPPPGVDWMPLARDAARAISRPVAVLTNVPFAVSAEGEAAAVAASLASFVRDGDPDRPLPIAMARAASAAMDTLEQWSLGQAAGEPMTRFVLVGGGVRGWGTWIAAGIDHRVVGTMVAGFDLAKLDEQRREAFASLDGLESADPQRLLQLVGLVDPTAIAAHASAPLWIVRGTNDAAYPLDALDHYAWELTTPFRSTHRMNRGGDVAAELPLDELRWLLHWSQDPAIILPGASLAVSGSGVTLVPEIDSGDISKVRLWSASSETLDFSGATWVGEPMARDAHQWLAARPRVAEGARFQALIGELVLLNEQGIRGTITTVPVILSGGVAAPKPKTRLFVPPKPAAPAGDGHDH